MTNEIPLFLMNSVTITRLTTLANQNVIVLRFQFKKLNTKFIIQEKYGIFIISAGIFFYGPFKNKSK